MPVFIRNFLMKLMEGYSEALSRYEVLIYCELYTKVYRCSTKKQAFNYLDVLSKTEPDLEEIFVKDLVDKKLVTALEFYIGYGADTQSAA